MSLLWPGDHRAGDLFSNGSLLLAILRVERAWLGVLVEQGVAPGSVQADIEELGRDLAESDLMLLGEEQEDGGNVVIALVELMRRSLAGRPAATWLHRGLTSQDVLDSALMLEAGRAGRHLLRLLDRQIEVLARLADDHRASPMVARTLGRHAVPTTFGLKVATWLTAILDACDDVAGLEYPVQVGGVAGTQAALSALGLDAMEASRSLAQRLDLADSAPWHGARRPVTRAADATVACCDSWGRVAADVLVLSRPEVSELTLGRTGGSSTLPGKENPTLAVLIRRAALVAPHLAAALHAAAANQVDERADGAWHAEWEPLALLLRHAVTAGEQVGDLLESVVVRTVGMAERLEAAGGLREEQQIMHKVAGTLVADVGYLGSADHLIDQVLARAAARLSA